MRLNSRSNQLADTLQETNGILDETRRLLVREGYVPDDLAVGDLLATPVTGRMPLWGRGAVTLGIIASFAVVTRFEPSVMRATFVAGVALFARTHQALLKAPGRAAAHKGYLAALKQAPERMPDHYRSVVDKHQLTERISDSSPSATEMTVGFWLRRMGDGTEEPLAAALKQLIQDYDPPLYTELYGAPDAPGTPPAP